MKKNGFRKISLLLLFFVMATVLLCLSGCGGGSDECEHEELDYDGYCYECGEYVGGPLDGDSVMVSIHNMTDDPNYVLSIAVSKYSPARVSDFSRAGYTFLGLFDAAEGGIQVVGTDGYTMFDLSSSCELWARWEKLTYTHRFSVAENGFISPSESLTVSDGMTVISLPVPEVVDGYEFVGWKSEVLDEIISDGGNVLEQYKITSENSFWFTEQTFVAVIQKTSYDVTLDYNDESGYTEILSFEEGTKVENLPVLESDYENKIEFLGWSTNPYTFTDYAQDEALNAICEDVTLFAFWARYRELTFIAEGMTNVHKIYENVTFEIPDPGVPGMKVDAWFTSEYFNTIPVSNITYNTPYDTFYAKMSIATYTITYVTPDNEAVPDDYYTINDEVILPVLEKEHFTFLGWCRSEALDDRPITRITIGNWGDATLYAKFQGDDKTVIFDDGNGSMNQKNAVLEYGANYTLPVPNYPGFAFMGWYLDSEFKNQITDGDGNSLSAWDIIDAETTVYARYEKKYFVSVTTSSPGAASFEVKPYYLKGERVELEIAVTEGYFYEGLFIDDRLVTNQKKYSFIMGEENVAITLKFYRVGNITLSTLDEAYAGYVSCVTKAKEGDTVYLNCKDSDYGITAIYVNGAQVELNDELSFIMPGGDAEVKVSFGPKRYYKIDTGDSGIELYQFKGHYYAIVGKLMNWTTANEYAKFFGGHLVIIETEAEQKFIEDLRTLKQLVGYGAWLGATDEANEGVWKWQNGQSLTYTNWAEGEPNNGSGIEHYAHIFANDTRWNDAGEAGPYTVIIEWDKTADMKFATVQSLLDSEGTEHKLSIYHYNNHYYSIVPVSYTWENAERFCEFLGGRLVSLETEDEAQFIYKLRAYTDMHAYQTWIGGSDAVTEGEWKWQSGAKFTYTNWIGGQPDNGRGVEDYAHLYGDGFMVWNDADGTSLMYFICEWDSFSNIGQTLFGNYFNLIFSKEDFIKYLLEAESTVGRDFTLMTDVDLAGVEWIPKDFHGTFNGGGNTIKNLTVKSSSGNVAMFLEVTKSIINLNFENLNVETSSVDYALVGGVCTALRGKLENVNVKSGTIKANNGSAGALAAAMYGGEIIDCANGASVISSVNTGAGDGVGGIVGFANAGTISGCHNFGAVSGASFTGGILGSSNGSSSLVIDNLKNSGKIGNTGDYTGGIAGYYSRAFTYNLSDMTNSGDVSGRHYVGGIFGHYNNSNSDAYVATYTVNLIRFNNSGRITGSGERIGGLVGYLYTDDYGYHSWNGYDGKVIVITENSHNTGDVTGTHYVGGIYGYARTDAAESVITAPTSKSKITAMSYAGAIAGYLEYINVTAPSNEGSSFVLDGAYIDGSSKWAFVGGYIGCAAASDISDATNNVQIDYSTTQCTGNRVGGICGSSSGLIINCTNNAVINAPSSTEVGGIAGRNDKGFTFILTGLTNTAEINGYAQVGGIFGVLYNNNSDANASTYTMSVKNLTNSGNIAAAGDYIGGLVGYLYTDDYGYHSYNGYDGQIILYFDNGINTGNVTGRYNVGGIFGYARTDSYESKATNVSSSADIVGEAIVGGIAGQTENINFTSPSNEGTTLTVSGTYLDGSVKRAWIGGYIGYAIGTNVTGAVNNVEINYSTPLALGTFIGGIAGQCSGILTDCTNNAKINAPKSAYVGGIAGWINTGYTYTSERVSNTGEITGESYVGGAVGYLSNSNSDANSSTYTMTLNYYTNSGNVLATGDYVGGIFGNLYTYDYGYHSYNGYDGQIILYLNNTSNTGNVKGRYQVGGIFGYAYTDTTASTVTAVSSSADIVGEALIGAIAGQTQYVNFISPTNEGSTVTVSGSYLDGSTKRAWVGGYIGYAISSDITGAVNNVQINYSTPLALGSYVGGIAGYCSGLISDCTNNADIYAPKSIYVGGIAGAIYKGYTYKSQNLSNTGNVTGLTNVGGITGLLENANSDANASTYIMELDSYTNSGDIVAGENFAGGIFGKLYTNDYGYHSYNGYDGSIIAYVSNVKSSGSVTGVNYVGGLIGHAQTDNAGSMMFAFTSESTVTGTENTGDYIGYTSNFTISE